MSARRVSGVVAGVVSVGAVVAAVAVFNLPSSSGGDGSASADAVPPTAGITEQTLVDREDHDGTIDHGDTTSVTARGGGTVTMLPAPGTMITRGKAVYRLDDKPVTLLYGSLPAYRTLAPGLTGADVEQFERNLWAMGYRGFTVDEEYTSATADAVEQWQDDLDLRETGTVEPGQISYAVGAVRVDAQVAQQGAVVQPGAELIKTTGTAVVATVDLDTTSQRLAKKGAAVRVTMPDGSVAAGRITKAVTVIRKGDQNQDVTKIEVTIAFAKAPKGIDSASVTVAFIAGSRTRVLTVPVSALLALAEGGYGVQVVAGGRTTIVPVTTGLFADGRVEVSGAGLAAGTRVGVPS